jgi:hypothetical protein
MNRTIVAIAMSATLAFLGYALAAQEAADIFVDASEIHARAVAGIVNPLFGGGAELELRNLGGRFDLRAGASYGIAITGMTVNGAMPLFGSEGFGVFASVGYRYSKKTSERRTFFAVKEVARDSSSVTYAGFYYQAPYHVSFSLELGARCEPTGVLVREEGPFPDLYAPSRGHTLLLFPSWRFQEECNYSIPDYMEKPRSSLSSLSLGPLFSPDFSRIGGMMSMYLCSDNPGINFFLGGDLGYLFNNGVPENASFRLSDEEDPYDGAMRGLVASYLPWKLTLGISYRF